MWKLVIEDDEGKRTAVPLSRDQYTIGRKEGAAIRLTERNVSREHARVCAKSAGAAGAGTFFVEDLTSYNGVFVNGLRVTHARDLAHGDLVQIADYRIAVQDEALSEATTVDASEELKKTVPGAPSAMALLERPTRLVMLAGPTPGTEYPLGSERLTIGRADEASISVDHNSVSRLHCEVHALDDGRFEVVDKGSSNGVRVNGADLRRGIVEPGDVIELGDVKFKFIAAGEIFVPTESQRLDAIGHRAAGEHTGGRRGANAVPIAIFAAVVAGGAVGAWAYTRSPDVRAARVATAAALPQGASEAPRKICATGDCNAPGAPPPAEVAVVPSADDETSQVDARAREPAARVTVTAGKGGWDLVDPTPAKTRVTVLAGDATARPTELAALAGAAAPGVVAPAPKASSVSVDERERQLALQGTTEAKMLLKQQIEQRIRGGKASDTEIRLLISTCKDLGDKGCVQQARAALAQKQSAN